MAGLRGRPRVSPERVKATRVWIQATVAEADSVCKAAFRAGKSVSGYLRELLPVHFPLQNNGGNRDAR